MDNLEEIADRFDQSEGFNGILSSKYDVEKILELCPNRGSILELGCGEGLLTRELVKHFDKVVAVDGSSICIEKARDKLLSLNWCGKAELIKSMFEDFETDEKFDNIILVHVLEHVDDPVTVLMKAKELLKYNGRIIIIVPNAESIHRAIGMEMGIIHHICELNDKDKIVGHKRYYTPKSLTIDVKYSGLKLREISGVMLKFLPNDKMYELNDKYLDALYEIGRNYPKNCGELVAVCTLKDGSNIHPTAEIHPSSYVHPSTVIAENVKIGPNCTIGYEGFNYPRDDDGIPQHQEHKGIVVIESNVEILAGSITLIEKDTKIDNLVHIAHDCHIGQGNHIVAGTVLGGGVTIGKNNFLGINSMIKPLMTIGDNNLIGMGAVVLNDIGDNEIWAGVPARKIKDNKFFK
jgi:2-polyprenyl-3-methyl-5-hydroxy-6-metoxy-1,4-benzoquinol methylase/acetyltransferase-like isoleucine patch superfamily enzyme